MKKLLVFFVASVSLLFLNDSTHVIAQESKNSSASTVSDIFPLPPDRLPNILGQQHSYTVTYRGNGEAVVTLRVTLFNVNNTSLETISLRVPRVQPQDIFSFQIIREPQCIQYGQGNGTQTPTCIKYQDPDSLHYWYGDPKYQKATHKIVGDTVTISLPKPIAPNTSGSFILSYRALGYGKKDIFGAYNTTFETLKINDKISDVVVGITTDSDLFLRGAKGKISYRFEEPMMAMKSDTLSSPARIPQVDQFVQQIGQGEITKKATNLQPLDSYTVKVSYADSRWKLYAKEIIGGILITAVIFVAIALGFRFLMRRSTTEKRASSDVSMISNIAIVGITSFGASLILLIFTILLMLAARMLEQYYLGEYSLFIILLGGILSVLVYGLFLLGPALFLGFRKGIAYGVTTAIGTILWLVIYLVAFLLLAISTQTAEPPIRIMKSLLGQPANDMVVPETLSPPESSKAL